MRKALCVGIDFYQHFGCLDACVSDAESVAAVLDRHADGTKNFEIISLLAEKIEPPMPDDADPEAPQPVIGKSLTAKTLKHAVELLFDTEADIVLFYFAGHGAIDANGGYLCTSEIQTPSEGLSLDYLMRLVSNSRAKNKVIILDSCHCGYAGKLDRMGEFCVLPENTTILASCTEHSTAADGCFTPLMIEALEGGAMNLMGEVSPGGIYSYIDRALGAWDQRPVFKANIKNFVCLRKNTPPISLSELRNIVRFFPKADYEYPLDPTYEEDKHHTDNKEVNPKHERIMALFRTYLKHNLLVPVGEEYLYWAAIHSKSCRLTALGQYYWGLVANDII